MFTVWSFLLGGHVSYQPSSVASVPKLVYLAHLLFLWSLQPQLFKSHLFFLTLATFLAQGRPDMEPVCHVTWKSPEVSESAVK